MLSMPGVTGSEDPHDQPSVRAMTVAPGRQRPPLPRRAGSARAPQPRAGLGQASAAAVERGCQQVAHSRQ